jgi:NADH-quinone oxidoreductase subunit N
MFLSVIIKSVFFIFFVKLISYMFFLGVPFVRYMLTLAAMFSIIIGCFGALYQKRIKRILAYSSINNIGFIVLGLSFNSLEGQTYSLMYAFFYFITIFLIFSIILTVLEETEDGVKLSLVYISDLPKLKKTSKIIYFIFAICLFSLAGIPPLSGFFIKFFLLNTAISAKLYFVTAVIALTSVISAFYYIHLLKVLFFTSFNQPVKLITINNTYKFIYLLLGLNVISFFLLPGFFEQVFTSLAASIVWN